MGRKVAYIIMFIILALMLRNLLVGAAEDSMTVDEVPHLAAGYSYVQAQDYRLNPEHPPLIKDLAGLAVSTTPVNYPFDYFYSHISNQYGVGEKFLYESKNDADAILFRGRLPIVAITIILGIFVFLWSSKLNGAAAGLLSLLLFAFDPNIVAHGHLVTQDIGISAAVVINLYFVWKFMKDPSVRSLMMAGLTLGLALATKFSAPLLFAVYLVLALYAVVKGHRESVQEGGRSLPAASSLERVRFYAGSFAIISLIAVAVVYVIYMLNMAKMPMGVQTTLIWDMLPADAPITTWLARSSLRPLAHYLLGFNMVKNHVSVGQGVYILGVISKGERYYYPLAFAIKSTIPMLLSVVLAFLFGRRVKSKSPMAEVALISGALAFGLMSIMGNLDLGLRYLLPIYPLFYIYAGKLIKLIRIEAFGRCLGGRFNLRRSLLNVTLLSLAVWQIITFQNISPYYLSYFNEFVGPERGGWIISDSNIDWGQDLKRLEKYVEEKRISKIYVDYFGGGRVSYYLGRKAVEWHAETPGRPRGWFAISSNNYTRAYASGQYGWLYKYKPTDRIGHSILVFKLP
ncbi:MAG: glycosyltransferase family 39 protein [Actinobacteria bacterium]|nr:glycosyltransferase family 39 protein [Actinomycetota bacterium]